MREVRTYEGSRQKCRSQTTAFKSGLPALALQKKKGYHIIHSIIYLFFIHSFHLSASAVTTGLAPVRCAAALLRHGQENNALLAALLAEVIGDAACAFFAAWVW
jgi:hypothetical protein